MSRVIDTPLILLFLTCLSTSPPFRARLATILRDSPFIWKTLVVFAAVTGLSIPFSHRIAESISLYVVMLATQTAAFFVACYVFCRPGRAEYGVIALWAVAVIVSVLGLLEAPEHHALWVGHIPSFLKVGDENVALILAGGSRYDVYRVQSVFSTSLGLAEFLGLIIPFVLHIVASPERRPAVRLAATATVPLMFTAVLATDSRLGLLGFFLGFMLYLLFWALMRWKRQNSLLGTAVVMSYPAIFMTAVAASFLIGRIRLKVWGGGQYDASNQGRKEQVMLGIPKVLSHPFGHGYGQGAIELGWAAPGGRISIDSFILNVAMESGWIGVSVFLFLFGFAAYDAVKVYLKYKENDPERSILLPLSISLFGFLAIKFVFAQGEIHPLVFMLLGMAVALIHRAKATAIAPPVPMTGGLDHHDRFGPADREQPCAP
jgi:O-antigen ligase